MSPIRAICGNSSSILLLLSEHLLLLLLHILGSLVLVRSLLLQGVEYVVDFLKLGIFVGDASFLHRLVFLRAG